MKKNFQLKHLGISTVYDKWEKEVKYIAINYLSPLQYFNWLKRKYKLQQKKIKRENYQFHSISKEDD